MLSSYVIFAQHPRRPLSSFVGMPPTRPEQTRGISHSPSPLLLPADHCPLPTVHYCSKSFSCNTYETPRKCCKQKTYASAKSFRCNTYKKQGGALRTRRVSQIFFHGRRYNFTNALAQRRHIFFRQTFGLDGVMQINCNFRRPQHPVARPVVLIRTRRPPRRARFPYTTLHRHG